MPKLKLEHPIKTENPIKTEQPIKIEHDVKVEIKEERRDPTSFLPAEEMSYEIKPKKKKKKKKRLEDPFKDIKEKILTPVTIITEALEPEVNIKVEDIEVELDFNDFIENDMYEGNVKEEPQEPPVKIEPPNHDAVILTFEQVVNANKTDAEDHKDITDSIPKHVCKVCHLVFKTEKTLLMHQRRKHKAFRESFEHICDSCGMSYETKNSLVAHIKRKHSDGSQDDGLEKTCEICFLVFKGKARLRMHMRRKHGAFEDAFKYVCPDCGLAYDKYRSLIIHVQRKHSRIEESMPDIMYNCPFCNKVFGKRETYARHVQRNHEVDDEGNVKPKSVIKEIAENCENTETGDIMCKECPLVFSSLGFLKLHMRRKHNALKENFKLKCSICSLSFEKVESLKRHVKRKHDKDTYCDVCNKSFESREQMLAHNHMRAIRECSLCGLIFATQGGLSKHMRCIHKKDLPKSVMCHMCSESFFDKRQLKVHLQKDHFNIWHECHSCSKRFVGKEGYRRHMLLKHPKVGTSNQEQKCEQCSESFTDEVLLCNHVALAHAVEKPNEVTIKKEYEESKDNYQCTKCPVQCITWEELRLHYEQNHRMFEETQCQSCGQLVRQQDLEKHMKIHKQVTLKCKYCEYKSNSKVSMTQHILRHKNATTLHCDFNGCKYKTYYDDAMQKHSKKHVDQGVKLQCTKCPFQTMNKYILRYHEEAHVTGKKRYQCDQCDYATILPANLVQHKYKHSSEKKFKCEVCPFATKYNTSLRFHVKKKHCDLPN